MNFRLMFVKAAAFVLSLPSWFREVARTSDKFFVFVPFMWLGDVLQVVVISLGSLIIGLGVLGSGSSCRSCKKGFWQDKKDFVVEVFSFRDVRASIFGLGFIILLLAFIVFAVYNLYRLLVAIKIF
ncbi:MAG: hypothetical protein V1645_01475 [archaeon]